MTDSPRKPKGLSSASIEQFSKIDPEKITGYLLEIYSSEIAWEQALIQLKTQTFGVFRIYEAPLKPIIAKKDEGREQIIKNGEIYYRYAGRTQKIRHAELESIINRRIERNNQDWLDLMAKIGRAGPQNAAILDTNKALIEKGEAQILVLDEDLVSKLKFIKQGQFVEKDGAPTLQLVGDVVPVDKVKVIKRVKENLIREYPFSAMDMVTEVKKAVPSVRQGQIWQVINDNNMKDNEDYCAYNFRNKKQEDEYLKSGVVPSVTPVIYNSKAIDFIANAIRTSSP